MGLDLGMGAGGASNGVELMDIGTSLSPSLSFFLALGATRDEGGCSRKGRPGSEGFRRMSKWERGLRHATQKKVSALLCSPPPLP